MKQKCIINRQLLSKIIRWKLYFLAIIMLFDSCGVKPPIDDDNGSKERVFYYPSGELRYSYNYLLKGLDTIKIDREISYFKKNKIKKIVYYNLKGEKDSTQSFYQSGNKKNFSEYKNDLKHGKDINRYPSGNIEYVIHHRKGLLEGATKRYYDTKKRQLRAKNYFKRSKRYLHQYEYDSKGNVETYIYFDPITSEVTYSAFYKDNTFLFGNGLKKPVIIPANIRTKKKELRKGTVLSCKIATISPPFVDSELYYRITGLTNEWTLIESKGEYKPYRIKHTFNNEGSYSLDVKFILNDPKAGKSEQTTSLDFTVVN